MTAVGDPAVGEVEASTVELILSPQVALLVVTTSGGVVTILPIGAVEATLVGAFKELIRPGFIHSPEVLVLARREGLGCLTVRAPVPVDLGWVTSSRPIPVAVAAATSLMVTVKAKASFGGIVAIVACAAAVATLVRAIEDSQRVLVLAGVAPIPVDDPALVGETFGKIVAAAVAMSLVGATGGLVNAALVGRTPSFGGMLPAAAVATTVASLRFRSSILSFAADDMVDAMREEPFLALRVTGMILDRSS